MAINDTSDAIGRAIITVSEQSGGHERQKACTYMSLRAAARLPTHVSFSHAPCFIRRHLFGISFSFTRYSSPSATGEDALLSTFVEMSDALGGTSDPYMGDPTVRTMPGLVEWRMNFRVFGLGNRLFTLLSV